MKDNKGSIIANDVELAESPTLTDKEYRELEAIYLISGMLGWTILLNKVRVHLQENIAKMLSEENEIEDAEKARLAAQKDQYLLNTLQGFIEQYEKETERRQRRSDQEGDKRPLLVSPCTGLDKVGL